MDCQSIRASSESLDSLRHACESQSGQVNLKVRQIDSGWIVTDSDDQPVSPNGRWLESVDAGAWCIKAPSVAICSAPPNVPVLKSINGGVPITSKTGYVFMTLGLIADLKKVN